MARLRGHLRALSERLGFERDWYLIALGAIIGIITALAAIGFIKGLTWVEHQSHDAQHQLPLWLLPIIPMAGALVTGVLVHLFASEARGHGVPQVMKAIMKQGGVINPKVGLVKVIASICTVGSGGSAGAEGPIVQIGSTAGSYAGQKLRLNREQVNTLLGCGAAAGIASVFNAPIAGVFFVLEILLARLLAADLHTHRRRLGLQHRHHPGHPGPGRRALRDQRATRQLPPRSRTPPELRAPRTRLRRRRRRLRPAPPRRRGHLRARLDPPDREAGHRRLRARRPRDPSTS